MMEDRQPIAEGSFSKTPFAHILLYLLEKQKSGTLVIEHEKATLRIYFRNGKPAKVQTDIPKRGLGHVLILLKAINEEQLEACNTLIANEGGYIGKRLIELNYIDIDTLIIALRRQMLLKLTDVFALTSANYAFFDTINMLSGFGPDELFPIHPYPVIMAGLRTYADRMNLAPYLNPIQRSFLSVNDDMETIRSFRLSSREKQVVGLLLSGPRPYPEITESGIWDREVARYVIYAMLITKQLQVQQSVESVPTAQPRSLSSTPPSPRETSDPKINEVRKRVSAKAIEIGTENYYEMLGVNENASIDEIRKAYFVLAKTFHPDRLPNVLKSELSETIQYLFSNLTEAHTVLTDPSGRESYDQIIGKSAHSTSSVSDRHSQQAVRDALSAESLFQRALVFLNQKHLDKARELVEEAQILVPDEGEYVALSAHLQVLSRPKGANFNDLESKLRNAAEQCPKSERVNLFFADVLKRTGKINESRRYYNRTLEINPHNIDAAREIRLIEMQKKRQGDSSKGGFFKKIFK